MIRRELAAIGWASSGNNTDRAGFIGALIFGESAVVKLVRRQVGQAVPDVLNLTQLYYPGFVAPSASFLPAVWAKNNRI